MRVKIEIVLSSRLPINHTTVKNDVDPSSTSGSNLSYADDGPNLDTANSSDDIDSEDKKVVADKPKPKLLSSYLLTNHPCASPSSDS